MMMMFVVSINIMMMMLMIQSIRQYRLNTQHIGIIIVILIILGRHPGSQQSKVGGNTYWGEAMR